MKTRVRWLLFGALHWMAMRGVGAGMFLAFLQTEYPILARKGCQRDRLRLATFIPGGPATLLAVVIGGYAGRGVQWRCPRP